METLKERLKKKGWEDREIARAISVMDKARKERKGPIRILDAVVYWFVLLVAIVGNFLISVVLVPFLIAITSAQLYSIIIILGLSFGILFNLIIRDIDSLTQRHYIIAGLFIPVLALINVYIITALSNELIEFTQVQNSPHNPVLVSLVYTVFFIAPYVFYKHMDRMHRKAAES